MVKKTASSIKGIVFTKPIDTLETSNSSRIIGIIGLTDVMGERNVAATKTIASTSNQV